ncbi:transcription factor S-II, central domain-containing protein [Neohortaea acidophila]|uniref:Transcription factor S-II, central domain-containing protein n=1 Tax=Neohortaea acidophila TaxID=245834 RepID=A0A6A6PRW4_9PEZI|nr:transcription factor S-II, central domain-containing protein [Neohortaea acidophila]KAF2482421.1 transcription factor S-II, central domain-containing protein [Neohortaea acidophila]
MAAAMDVKQLQETSRQLSKAFDGGDPSTTLLTLLAPLEKWKASEDLLRQSKIGIAVSKLRSSKDSKVALLASQLINKWKADVKTKKPGVTGTPGKNGLNGDLRSQTNSPAPKKEVLAPPPPAPKKFSVAPEKRNAKEDGVDTALTGNPTRDGSITLIYNGLAFMSEEAPADILAVSKSVEAAAFELYQPETSTTYKQKMRSLHLNLKMKQNAELRKDVFSRAIEPKRFVSMSSEELKSEEMRKKEKEIAKENMNKSMTPSQDKSISTTLQCGKCKQSKVAYSLAQTRSADEPMTAFCECTVCGHFWKFS